MDNKRPKRRKDKYNPYTLLIENQKYYISFKDIHGIIQKTEVKKEVFMLLIVLNLKIFL